jgi:Outer membrane protein
MKTKRIILLPALLIALSVNAQQVMTLEKCRRLALENNRQMEQASGQKEKATHDVKAAKANFLPRFTGTGLYLYSGSEMKMNLPESYLPTFVPDGAGSLIPNLQSAGGGTPVFNEYAYLPATNLRLKLNGFYTAGIQAEQPLYMGGRIHAAYQMSQIGEEIAGLNEHLTRADVIMQTDEAYWNHVRAKELELCAGKYDAVITELLRNVENAVEAGMKSRNDLLKVQVKKNEAELQLLQSGNAVRLSRMNLCHILGIPPESDILINASFDDRTASFQIDNQSSITSRPEYAILNKQVELKAKNTRLVRSEFLPTAGVSARYGYNHGLELNGHSLLDKASFSAVVSISIPIFHWGEGRNKVRAAQIEKRIAESRREDVAEMLSLELAQALNNYEESQLEVTLTTRSLAQAEENLKVSRDHYDAGMETLADHLEAQTIWQKALADLTNAKASLKMSETKYLKAAGRL